MVGVVFDVTERKQAQQEREELGGRLINAQVRSGWRAFGYNPNFGITSKSSVIVS